MSLHDLALLCLSACTGTAAAAVALASAPARTASASAAPVFARGALAK